MKLRLIATALLIVGCAQTVPVFVEKQPDTGTAPPDAMSNDPLAQHGQYLVTLLGCGSCHTDGALTGQANSKLLLAGSRTGIAISNPLKVEHPGMVFPPNLTPDKTTGLGHWSETDIVLMLKAGEDRHGIRQSPVMPWSAYAQMSDDDARAIARYLKRLAPVSHKVPTNVRPGQASDLPHVYFGVYQKP
ncbi:c-type cytochrome [Simiduia agarivorans]|uniref:Cytochrome c protein n=1 Tax=Simiduia agarivorans (strain DSM 21679 / JCM 13881 / BCRC 17597 / SA1) TaxID=1117647 RepID=K4KJB5_SIMAS|nr:c-type cytochrome [Simiduia agarivorans]AFU99219.1 cytochrome c protein [Simiduia agarivorans SA1 = DSM 21679]